MSGGHDGAATTGRAAGEQPPAHPAHLLVPDPPEGFWYSAKCRVLGPPLVTGQLGNQRLSRPLALGVLSCDGLSSAAYGTLTSRPVTHSAGRACS
jgi:hypothetical protein